MRKDQSKIVVFGNRLSGLLERWRMLNDLGFFNVILRNSLEELVEQLEAGETFDVLLFDGFDGCIDSESLRCLAWYNAVESIIISTDVNSQQCREILEWWYKRSVSSLRVLQLPVRMEDLRKVMTLPTDQAVSERCYHL